MGNKWNMEDNDGAISVLTSQNDIEYIVISSFKTLRSFKKINTLSKKNEPNSWYRNCKNKKHKFYK